MLFIIHGGIDNSGSRRRINITADIDNRSSEPALYSSYHLYFDESFRARVTSGLDAQGQMNAPNGERCNAYVRQLMAPTDFPVIKEQTKRIVSLALDLPPKTPTDRFVIGSSIRAPGCERVSWQTINFKDHVALLGNYRIR
jgi:hypothetical protein